MEYVLVGVILLVILAVFGAVMVRMGTGLGGSEGKKKAPFAGPDKTPAGDTSQHAGDTSSEGHTDTADAGEHGGTGEPASGPESQGPGGQGEPPQPTRLPEGRVKRDPIGGEAEGETMLPAEESRPR